MVHERLFLKRSNYSLKQVYCGRRTARFPFVHYSSLFLCTFSVFNLNIFFHVALFSCCTFFILHYFHVTLFCVVIFSCFTFFMLHSIYVLHYFMLHIQTLLFFLLDFVHVAPFPEVQPGPPQTSKMESFVTIINKAI